MTPLFTFLPFLATKQSLLKKINKKIERKENLPGGGLSLKQAQVSKPNWQGWLITTTTSDGGFFSPSTKHSFSIFQSHFPP